MKLNNRLYDYFKDKGEKVTVEMLILGLGYTAVTTSDGGIGISYTYFDQKTSCSLVRDYYDYEGKPALVLLEKIKSIDPIERSMALALVNALYYEKALLLPEDPKNEILFEQFNVREGTKVAMVGEAFEHLPVHMLAGTVPVDKENVLKAVRHGIGTRFIHQYSKKSFWLFSG